MSQAPNIVSQAPSMAFQPQTNFMAPFHFSPVTPTQTFPMSLANNGEPRATGTNNYEAS